MLQGYLQEIITILIEWLLDLIVDSAISMELPAEQLFMAGATFLNWWDNRFYELLNFFHFLNKDANRTAIT